MAVDDALADNTVDDAIVGVVPEDVQQDDAVDTTVSTRQQILDRITSRSGRDVEDDDVGVDDAEQVDEDEKPTAKVVVDASVPVPVPGFEPPKVEPPKEEVKTESDEKDAADGDIAAGTFRVKGVDGKFVEAPKDIKFEFRVGDKVYTKEPAGLVRLAIDGIAGQRTAVELKDLKEVAIPRFKEQVDGYVKGLREELDLQKALNRDMLDDESGEKWLANRTRFLELNSPEARAERAERKAQDLLDQASSTSQQAEITAYHSQNIVPVIHAVDAATPDVSEEAKAGKIALFTGPLLVNGVIPPQRFPELRNWLNGPYAEWARTEQNKIVANRDRLQADASAKIEAEKERLKREARELQRQKNVQAKGLKPVGTPSTSTAPAELPRPKNRKEALDRIASRPWVNE